MSDEKFNDAATTALGQIASLLHVPVRKDVDVVVLWADVVNRARVCSEALAWISTHEGISVAAAKRTQRVAAGALYEGRGPTKVLACKGCGAMPNSRHAEGCAER